MTEVILGGFVGFLLTAVPLILIMKKKLRASEKRFSKQQELHLVHSSELEKQLSESASNLKMSAEESTRKYTQRISDLSDSAADQSDFLSKKVESVTAISSTLTEQIVEVYTRTQHSSDTTRAGMEHVNNVAADLQGFNESSQRLVAIKQQFEQVRDRTEAIRFVGEEAEMLALNAAIEAARAGEAGRGFAVVADAMKSLSRNSQDSTLEIQKIVSQSEQTISTIIEEFMERTETLNNTMELVLKSFSNIDSSIGQISSMSQKMQTDAQSSVNKLSDVEAAIKTVLESQVKDLSNLVSTISGTKVINLSPKEAHSQLSAFDEVIDVRRPNEWNDELGHLSQAKLATLQTDFKQYVKQLDPAKKYLFICRSGGRSTKAAQMAIAQGVKQAYNLDGGMLAWRKVQKSG